MVIDNTVDFGASDAAMTPEEMGKVADGVQLLPMTAGSIVLAYNLPGVENLKLTRDAYAGIFLGKITRWNDKAIADANPEAKLPDSDIQVVVRADGSGTTFVFARHLMRSARISRKVPERRTAELAGGQESQGKRRRRRGDPSDARRDRIS